MSRQRARRAHFSVHGIAAIGGAAAAAIFVMGWGLYFIMGTTAEIYLDLITSVEMGSVEALIQGAAVSFAIGSLAGAAVAWISNRLGLLVETE